MGNQPSMSGDTDFATEDGQAAKRTKKGQSNSNPQQQYKAPQLQPMAAKVVRPHDSQVVYNHGRVGIAGLGHEHQNFACICKEIAEAREDQQKLLELQKQRATAEAVNDFKAAITKQQQQKMESKSPPQSPTNNNNGNNGNNNNTPQQLKGVTSAGEKVSVLSGPAPTPTPIVTPLDVNLMAFPTLVNPPGVVSPQPNIIGGPGQDTSHVPTPSNNIAAPISGADVLTTPPQQQQQQPPPATIFKRTSNNRCPNCGGVLEDFNETTIPSCSWIDGTMPLGSLITSMAAAQQSFSDSLKQVQSEDQPLLMLSNMTGFDLPTVRALQAVFTKISDLDGKDNLISAEELCHATGVPPDSILGKAMFRLMDITRSNNVNFRTWIMMLAKLSPQASLEDKISFAFNIYDDNGDGFIDRHDLIAMLTSVIPDLGEHDALLLIESIFDEADEDGDRRIDYDDYKQFVVNSKAFYEAFTIDIATVLREHYGVIADDVIEHRIMKLHERDLRQEERASQVNEKETLFMEREHEAVTLVDNLDELDL